MFKILQADQGAEECNWTLIRAQFVVLHWCMFEEIFGSSKLECRQVQEDVGGDPQVEINL